MPRLSISSTKGSPLGMEVTDLSHAVREVSSRLQGNVDRQKLLKAMNDWVQSSGKRVQLTFASGEVITISYTA